ncbi:MAG TPA: NAD(P)/FAD-dependent oxidoreductase [Chloroflexota bacterium]|jgi:protoporphyrinogen oxidase
MSAPPRIGVIGGGILGLTAALRFVQAGAQVKLFEREERVGGLVASFEVGGTPLERFYHHLFRSDVDVQALIHEVGLGEHLVWLKPDTSVLTGGKFYSLDSATDVLRFSPLGPIDRFRLGAAIGYLRLETNYHRLEGKTAAAWIRQWMGPEVYRVLWGPLLESKFGVHAEKIALPWFWSRVHLRSPALGYVRGGFFRLYQRLADLLEEKGVELHLGAEVKAIRSEGGTVRLETGDGEETFDALLATTPTRLFMRLAQGLSDEYRARYDWGEFSGAHSVILVLNRPLMDGIYWLNVNDPGFPFLAAVEHTNYMPASDYSGLHVLYLGNYLPMDHPLYGRPDEDVLTEFTEALKRINPQFDRSWVVESHIFKAPYAQPIVTVDYPDHIPPHQTPLPGVFLANMFQVYPQDRGQNYSVRMANGVAKQILASLV